MSALLKRKVNYNRNNSFRSVMPDVEISASRNNLTGEVSITINQKERKNGGDQYRLDLSSEQFEKLRRYFQQ